MEGHSQSGQIIVLPSPCHSDGHSRMMSLLMFGLLLLAVLECACTFNYKAQQCVVVCLQVPVTLEASQAVDTWPGGYGISDQLCLDPGIAFRFCCSLMHFLCFQDSLYIRSPFTLSLPLFLQLLVPYIFDWEINRVERPELLQLIWPSVAGR